MMDTRLPNLLHDLASEMPVDVEGSAPRTLRKARGRRVVAAVGAGLAVAALVVVSVSALRLPADRTVPAVTGPSPEPKAFEGLWPETDAESLAVTQAAVDEGHQPLRTTPDGTATLLAVDLLGWEVNNVSAEVSQDRSQEAVVLIRNGSFGENVPPVVVGLRQLGRTGPSGVWSVVQAGNLLIDPETQADAGTGVVHVSGRIPDLYEGAPALEAHVFDGPTLEPSLGSARYELTDRTFGFDVEVSATPDGRATLLLTMPDAIGESLGAALVSVETPVGALPQAVDVTGVPPDVAATAQRIYDGALAHDVDALAQLLDPNTFVFNLDDGSDPTPAWRDDPSVLDLAVAVLRLPAAAPRDIEGYGTFYIWPYLVDSDFSALTQQERADLAALGYTDEQIDLMIEGGHGYQGPRLAIDADGLWRNFITVGE
jgi:hypothetical protein